MAQIKDETKRIAIRDAVIANVVEHGLNHAPVSHIAKRAGVSAGTVYIYYPSKDDMLQDVYLEIKALSHDAMMDAYRAGADSEAGLRNMWFSMFEFMQRAPKMFMFHEVIAAQRVLAPRQRDTVAKMAGEIHDILRAGVADGTLRDMPIECLASLYIAPAVSLFRRVMDREAVNPKLPAEVFDATWRAIAR